jgi:hypothetical protein
MRKRPLWILFLAALFATLSCSAVAAGEFVAIDSGFPEGVVYAIAAESYAVNLGVSNGIKKGEFFLVYYDGGSISDVNGVLIGRYKIPAAVIEAENVSASSSECRVVSPSKGWVIQRGDRVMPITAASANHLRFAAFGTTPEKPRLKGYSGRWIRVAPATNPLSAVVQYYHPWTLTEVNQPARLQAPGHYYYETLQFPISVLDASPRVLPSAGSGVYPGEFPAEPPAPPPVLSPEYLPYIPVPYDFDVNGITDLRLVRTFPITQVEMYALEIQHRNAWDMYSKKRYKEALAEFAQQAVLYYGNYLSPYWAGKSALMTGDSNTAEAWFSAALNINPHYRPAMDEIFKITANRQKNN